MIQKHLTFWNENVDIKTFAVWCKYGDYWKNIVMNHIIQKKYKNILDVGAGVFDEYYRFKKHGYKVNYYATEITDQFIRFAKNRSINVIKAPIDKLPFPDDYFDITICYDVFNHQKSFRGGIEEIIRVSKSEAIISFFKPFADEEDGLKEINDCKEKFNIDYSNEDGVCIERFKDENENVTCIYNHFYQEKLEEYLKSLKNIQYSFLKIKANKNINDSNFIRIYRITKNNNRKNSPFYFLDNRPNYILKKSKDLFKYLKILILNIKNIFRKFKGNF